MADASTQLQVFLGVRRELVSYASTITGDRAQAEDIVQEAWIRFTPAAAVEQPVAYLYRIVRNLALDLKRSRSREQAHQASAPAWLHPGHTADPADSCQHSMLLDRLSDTLQAMPEASRLALEMHRFGGCTLAQIAQRLGVSLSTAHRLLRDALARLAQEVDEPDADGASHEA
ncbi:RNA polymerase sigma factor [Pseudomonas sp. NPDC089554]|uniref:RNA polymerase sigma factor n=1 Tax=Pseudomonas sp. NPDC089554 TaxID=3390653 RepID=UPI003D093FA1